MLSPESLFPDLVFKYFHPFPPSFFKCTLFKKKFPESPDLKLYIFNY